MFRNRTSTYLLNILDHDKEIIDSQTSTIMYKYIKRNKSNEREKNKFNTVRENYQKLHRNQEFASTGHLKKLSSDIVNLLRDSNNDENTNRDQSETQLLINSSLLINLV
jgi:hypothetical protein